MSKGPIQITLSQFSAEAIRPHLYRATDECRAAHGLTVAAEIDRLTSAIAQAATKAQEEDDDVKIVITVKAGDKP